MRELETEVVKIENISIEYMVKGKGKDFLFLHGGGVSFRNYLKFIDETSKYFRVYAPSVPGAGKSDSIPKIWKFEDYSRLVRDFVVKMGIKPYISGHSFGGAIAISSKARYPDNFKNLILFSSAGGKNASSKKSVLKVVRHDLNLLFNGFFLNKKTDSYIDKMMNVRNHLPSMLRMSKFFDNLDLSQDLKKIKEKVYVFWGENDDVLPSESIEVFKKYLSNKEIYLLDGGHRAFVEKGDKVLRIIHKELGDGK